MESYRDLVQTIQNNPVLSERIQKDMEASPDCINLITSQWETKLSQSKFYNRFSDPSEKPFRESVITPEYRVEELFSNSSLTVLVAGECRFGQPFKNRQQKTCCILVSQCEPLMEIAKTMTKYMNPPGKLSNEFKFQFKSCSILSCVMCHTQVKAFQAANFNIEKISQACIADTKIFDGHRILNRFQCQMNEIFRAKFHAIVQLKIHQRYSYKTEDGLYCRIAGEVLDIIGFQADKLNVSKKPIDLGNLHGPDLFENPQTVEDFEAADSAETPARGGEISMEQGLAAFCNSRQNDASRKRYPDHTLNSAEKKRRWSNQEPEEPGCSKDTLEDDWLATGVLDLEEKPSSEDNVTVVEETLDLSSSVAGNVVVEEEYSETLI